MSLSLLGSDYARTCIEESLATENADLTLQFSR